jgi:hypothetical protein
VRIEVFTAFMNDFYIIVVVVAVTTTTTSTTTTAAAAAATATSTTTFIIMCFCSPVGSFLRFYHTLVVRPAFDSASAAWNCITCKDSKKNCIRVPQHILYGVYENNYERMLARIGLLTFHLGRKFLDALFKIIFLKQRINFVIKITANKGW